MDLDKSIIAFGSLFTFLMLFMTLSSGSAYAYVQEKNGLFIEYTFINNTDFCGVSNVNYPVCELMFNVTLSDNYVINNKSKVRAFFKNVLGIEKYDTLDYEMLVSKNGGVFIAKNDIPLGYVVNSGSNYTFKFRAIKNDFLNIDIVPELFDFDLTEFAYWNRTYNYSQNIIVENKNSTHVLPVNYTLNFTINTQQLGLDGKLFDKNNCSDLRMVWGNNASTTHREIDRIVENCNSTDTMVYFALQEEVGIGDNLTNHSIYYGWPLTGEGNPPEPMKNFSMVYLYHNNFSVLDDWTDSGLYSNVDIANKRLDHKPYRVNTEHSTAHYVEVEDIDYKMSFSMEYVSINSGAKGYGACGLTKDIGGLQGIYKSYFVGVMQQDAGTTAPAFRRVTIVGSANNYTELASGTTFNYGDIVDYEFTRISKTHNIKAYWPNGSYIDEIWQDSLDLGDNLDYFICTNYNSTAASDWMQTYVYNWTYQYHIEPTPNIFLLGEVASGNYTPPATTSAPVETNATVTGGDADTQRRTIFIDLLIFMTIIGVLGIIAHLVTPQTGIIVFIVLLGVLSWSDMVQYQLNPVNAYFVQGFILIALLIFLRDVNFNKLKRKIKRL